MSISAGLGKAMGRTPVSAVIESLEGRALLSTDLFTLVPVEPPPEVVVGPPGPPPLPAVTIAAKPVVRGGARYTFKATFNFTQPIAPDTRALDPIEVHGPNGFVGQAEPGKLKVSRDRMSATAKFRVTAPGGRFDATDNGVYAIVWAGTVTRVAASSTQLPVEATAGQPGPLATFNVEGRFVRGQHAPRSGTRSAASGDTDLNYQVNPDDILAILVAEGRDLTGDGRVDMDDVRQLVAGSQAPGTSGGKVQWAVTADPFSNLQIVSEGTLEAGPPTVYYDGQGYVRIRSTG